MDDPTETLENFSLRARIQGVLPYLLFATIIVVGALIVARPWEDTLPGGEGAMGVVAQVPYADGEQVETLAHPEKLTPNFRLESLSGEILEMADLRGKPVFLNFWATWCFACVSEMPAMQRVADAYAGEVVVIGINVGEDADDARAFAESHDIDYQLLLDPSQDVTEEYLVRAMPTSIFVRADGVVDSVRYGAITENEMRELITPLLQEPNDLDA